MAKAKTKASKAQQPDPFTPNSDTLKAIAEVLVECAGEWDVASDDRCKRVRDWIAQMVEAGAVAGSIDEYGELIDDGDDE